MRGWGFVSAYCRAPVGTLMGLGLESRRSP